MDPTNWEKLEDLFHRAKGLASSERDAVLAAEDDAAIRAQVAAMLEGERRGGSILDLNPMDAAEGMLAASDAVPERKDFGNYRILQYLGRGGMGEVWKAEYKPVGRVVALKFLTLAGPAAAARFDREKENLSGLECVNIPHFYEAGTDPVGDPYFAMEYVSGMPIDQYCRDRKCSLGERLALFYAVCEALKHAHFRNVVHLDLKPANILVTGDGAPKVLDFGVARRLDRTRGQAPLTAHDGLTPAYASPEQLRGEPVGPLSDIYSLGLILYELLTGRRVRNSATLASSSTLAESEERVANGMRLLDAGPDEVPGLHRARRSQWLDLEAICLKAASDEPLARYESVPQLMEDIQRFNLDRPLIARSGAGRMYRLRKYVRRNTGMVIVASLAFIAIQFLVGWLAITRQEAQAETERARHIRRFMVDAFTGGDQQAAPSKDVTLISAIDRAAAGAASFADDRETQVELDETLGTIYEQLNEFPKADKLLSAALDNTGGPGKATPEAVGALQQLGLLRGDQAQFAESERLLRQALQMAGRLSRPARGPLLLNVQASLGRVLVQNGSYAQALPLLKPIVEHPPAGYEGQVILTESLTALAVAEQYLGDYDAADKNNRQALDLDRKLHTNDYPRVAYDLANLATTATARQNFAEAEKLYREASRILDKWYGVDHPEAVVVKSMIGLMAMRQGRFSEAEEIMRNVLPLQERIYGGRNHPYVAFTFGILGQLAVQREHWPEAESDYAAAFAINNQLYGEGDRRTAVAASNLAGVQFSEGRYALAENTVRPAVETLQKHPLPNDVDLGMAHLHLGESLLKQHRYQDAEAPLAAAETVFRDQPGVFIERLRETRQDLAEVYEALQQPENAARMRAKLTAQ